MQQFTHELLFGDKKITLTINKLAPQANASVLATMGKTVVLATVVMGEVDETKDYFPLSVEFADKLYAGGFVKGGKWVKRELNPSDNSILFGRIIDRSIRPLFPEGFRNEIQLIVTVLSNDKENDTIVPAFIAASVALSVSNIPFNGPVSLVRIKDSSLDLLVCTGPAGVNMIEAGAGIVDNETVLKAIKLAKETGDQINDQIDVLVKKVKPIKTEYQSLLPSEELQKAIESFIEDNIKEFLENGADGAHMIGQKNILDKVIVKYKDKIENNEIPKNIIALAIDLILKKYVRKNTLEKKRYDGREIDEIRPINIEAGVLPCTHGSALFERGLTQALTITTLNPLSEKQYLRDSSGETTKRYFHYYSAAPFSTGQTGRFGRPGRREIGHGALAEKALIPVIPTEEEFPYTIALTSEAMSQNGSSSMASTCGSTLSLMDAGVPIKDKVAGISVGLVAESDDKYVLLTDIAGVEDHFGDMDFKITGTRSGITAIQLDIKRAGLTLGMIEGAFEASTKARLTILNKMEAVLAAPRKELSVYAPKIKLIKLPEDKIGEVIGSGGKTIRALMEKHGVQIDIDDAGNASISALDIEKVNTAIFEIESMVRDIQVGEEFDGVITRVEPFGAFVEFLPGREALLHVSEMTGGFLSDPSSIIKVGDKLHVKVSGFNDNHQIKLSAPEFKAAHPGTPRQDYGSPTRASYDRPQSFGKFRQDLRKKRF